MKAFYVCDPGNESAEVIFAEKRSQAIQVSEARQWHDYIDVRASRKPQYDRFAEQGFVPKQTLLEDGWWFECSGYKEDPKRRCCQHLTIDDNPVVINEKVYCQDCASREPEMIPEQGHGPIVHSSASRQFISHVVRLRTTGSTLF